MSRTAKTPKPTSNEFVAYYRVSTDKQGESGLGLDAQQQAVARYLAGLKGSTLKAEYTEVESGKRVSNRPQLAAALASCRKLGAVLVIAKLDRLARNVHFISGLMEAAADFVACDMPQANRLTVHIMAAFAEHEREMIAARTVAGLAMVQKELEEKGFRISKAGRRFEKLGNPRWAESIGKARANRHPATMHQDVSRILRERQQVGESLRTIAKALNGLGLKTPKGAAWHPSSVRAALAKLSPAPSSSPLPLVVSPVPLAA